ncbi:hypothetical protein AArcSl_0192 [Halalkaliarchaeum desulfuricum]|uniref:DUF3054 domain-containing protein n=1 Tax=Halalkaliarchaeum desulfuricum TaxID=2055893 RepID=A0A343TFH5_9EURY|nr:DUF3054 domain-containing protein [Halalkaliarchaeum desulfuricum]AUX07847.1 hypothetical protein AArcSl_0192 [Halalkaliarchaeum desulfuricum]
MDIASLLEERIDPGTLPIAVGDIVFLLAFLTIGALQHNPGDYLVENPLVWAGIVAPFLIGWIAVSPLVGAYSPGAGESAKSSIPLAVRSWILAAVVGMALRASPLFAGGFAVVFAAIMLVGGALFLGGWRYLYFKLFG